MFSTGTLRNTRILHHITTNTQTQSENFQETLLISSRFPGGNNFSSRFPGFPGVLDTVIHISTLPRHITTVARTSSGHKISRPWGLKTKLRRQLVIKRDSELNEMQSPYITSFWSRPTRSAINVSTRQSSAEYDFGLQ